MNILDSDILIIISFLFSLMMLIFSMLPGEKFESFGPTNFKIYLILVLIIFWVYFYDIYSIYLVFLLPTSILITILSSSYAYDIWRKKNDYEIRVWLTLNNNSSRMPIEPKLNGLYASILNNLIFIAFFYVGYDRYPIEDFLFALIFISIVCYFTLLTKLLYSITGPNEEKLTGYIGFQYTLANMALFISPFFIFDHWYTSLFLLLIPVLIIGVSLDYLFPDSAIMQPAKFVYDNHKFLVLISMFCVFILMVISKGSIVII